MSDGGLGDDLFPNSPGGSAPAPPSPIASGSKTPVQNGISGTTSPSPAKSPAPAEEAQEEELAAQNDDDDNMDDLFGEDSDAEKQQPGTPRTDRGRSSTATPPSRRSGSPNPLEYAEEEGEQEDYQQVVVNIPFPKRPRMEATDGKIWHLKLPAYVNIESEPYDADYYHALNQDEEEIDAKNQQLLAKQKILAVKNTIRWKWMSGTDGQPTRRSNARMVRWSDGSMSLQLGSDLFDVAPSYGASLARPEELQTEEEKLAKPAPFTSAAQTTFVCTPSQHERVLMTEGAIAGQLSLVPTSSTSKTHIELVKHVGQQHVKHSRMKILDDMKDPNFNELLAKASGRETVKPTRPKSARKSGSSSQRHRRTSRRDYDDDSDVEKDVSARRAGNNYEEDDGFIVADEDDEDEAEETEDEEDAAWGSKKSKSKSKSRKRKGSDDDDELDEMEEAERRIEQKERERKRAKKEKQKKSRDYVDTDDEDAEGEVEAPEEEDMEMDVESEDD